MNKKPVDKYTVPKYLWGTNCESFILVDTKGLSVKQESMPPNTKEQLHFHQLATQFFYIQNGEATFYIEGEWCIVGQYQGIEIEPKQQHFIENRTAHYLEFLVVSQPTTLGDRITID
jgi:mannose-6-phosphate isomerase-like protein (cupin superfamily)